MKIKLRANIVMSKELTIEANDWVEAVEKARTMMAEPIPYGNTDIQRHPLTLSH